MDLTDKNASRGAVLPDPLPVWPLRGPLEREIRVPGSKSITNRALVLAALSPGKVRLEGALFSRDTLIVMQALRELGFRVDADADSAAVTVGGCGGAIPAGKAEIQVGNAGTAARMLSAVVCLRQEGCFRFCGDAEMERRPMRGLLEALVAAGWAEVDYHGIPGHFPYTLRTRGCAGREITVDPSESSQMLSALLIAAAGETGTKETGNSRDPVRILIAGDKYRRSYVDLTMSMLKDFGANAEVDEARASILVQPGIAGPEGGLYPIEPDASSASYFFAMPLVVPARLHFPGFTHFPGLQGDLGLLPVLRQCGLEFSCGDSGLHVKGEGRISNTLVHDFYEISDTFLTVAALSPLFPGPLEISGIAHTRHQETDRVAGMARELAKLGVGVYEEKDRLRLSPHRTASKQLALQASPLIINTYKDHRFAMSFAILACFDLRGDGQPWLAIRDPQCSSKTFPNFFDLLASLNV